MTAGPLTEEERYRFDVQGFLVRRSVLGRREVERLNEQIDALDLPDPAETIESQRFTGLIEAGGLLRDLMDHRSVLEIVTELCGPFVRLDHAYGIIMAPGTGGLGLHGGGTPFDPAQLYAVDPTGIHTGLVAVQWAVVDQGPSDGGFCCIPGSHKAHFRRPAQIALDSPLVESVALAAGDLVVFTEALTHGTRPWNADRQRRSLLYKYSPGNSSWDDRPPCRSDMLPTLTAQQRRLCQPPSVARHERV